MENPLISIIVPVYNAGLYLDKCISSIIAQTYSNLEIILIDDGSTDHSAFIGDKYAEKDERIILVHKENGGVSSARNTALDLCRGKYILFVDSDDWIEANMVKRLIGIQRILDVDILMFGFYMENIDLKKTKIVCYEEGVYKSKKELELFLPKLIHNGSINPLWNKMYKSSIITANKLWFHEFLNKDEDALFNYDVFINSESLYVSNECFYHYNIGNIDSLTRKFRMEKYNMTIFVNNCLHDMILNKGLLHILPSAEYRRIRSVYSHLISIFHTQLTNKEKRECMKDILVKESSYKYQYLNSKLYRIFAFMLSKNNLAVVYCLCFCMYYLRKIRDRAGYLKLHP